MPQITIILTTIGSAEVAQSLAQKMVHAKLAACVQIDGPIQSVYSWNGQLCMDKEYRLSCKTLPSLCQQALQLLRQNHSYEVPELILAEVEASQDYWQWLSEQVQNGESA
ncbi:MAG: divalent-cation tolerance protein CutA [Pirellulales bacterium]